MFKVNNKDTRATPLAAFSKNNFFTEHVQTTASVSGNISMKLGNNTQL